MVGLLNVRLSDGRLLLDGKRVTGFSNEEEDQAQLTAHVPFLTEDELPPLIVNVHGGPTATAVPGYDLRIQYWTSRGFGRKALATASTPARRGESIRWA